MKRHRFDPASFMFGALFLVIGLTFLTGGRGTDLGHPVRLWPVTIVVVGLSLAIWAVSRAIRPEPSPVVAAAVLETPVVEPNPEDEGAAEATTVTAEPPTADDAGQDEGPRP